MLPFKTAAAYIYIYIFDSYITFACRLFNSNHSMVSVYTANGIGFVEALANASGIEGIRSFDFGATINSL